jgi:Cu2+-exporting ATPase
VPAFIVAVLLIASVTWFAWQSIDPSRAFSAMLSVLVASCPCALSLALPVVHAAASRRLLDEGVLLTRGEAVPDLTRIDTVIFDKTGTLTRGVPEVVEIVVNPERPGLDVDELLAVAGALEAHSAHPIAHAFQEAASNVPLAVAENVTVVPAQGLSGTVGGREWHIGTADFATQGRAPSDDAVWLADGEGWAARFELRDALREGAAETVAALQADGIRTAILSGDSSEAVEAVAQRLHIDDWQARQSPEMKLTRLQGRHADGDHILMVGDGVNDAPVLAAADVSMTVKGGAELANSTADMILTGESLSLVLRARAIARRSRQLIRQNLGWAVLYNSSVMPLAVSGLLKPWMAALGMSLSSLLVVANAARLVKERPAETQGEHA